MIERNVKTSLMFLITISFLFSVFIYSKSYLAVLLTLIVFVFELRRYIFPTFFKLDSNGIHTKSFYREKFYPWSKFNSVFIDKDGALLSPYKQKSLMEKFRGFYVLFGANMPTGAKEYILNKY